VQGQLRPLLACLRELGLTQEQTTAVFRALRRQRSAAAQFLSLSPGELRRRYFWLGRHLGLEGPAAAAYFAGQPCLLLAEPEQAAAVVHWLYSIHWRRLALRRNLATHPAILLAPLQQLEAAAAHLQVGWGHTLMAGLVVSAPRASATSAVCCQVHRVHGWLGKDVAASLASACRRRWMRPWMSSACCWHWRRACWRCPPRSWRRRQPRIPAPGSWRGSTWIVPPS
jgi:hypothetical protein